MLKLCKQHNIQKEKKESQQSNGQIQALLHFMLNEVFFQTLMISYITCLQFDEIQNNTVFRF